MVQPENYKEGYVPFHGLKDIPKKTLMNIIRQSGIDRKEFT